MQMDSVVLSERVLSSAARLHELKQQRDRIDADMAREVAQLTAALQGTSIQSLNGAGAKKVVPPAGTLQEKIFNWLKANGGRGKSAETIGTGVGHEMKKTRSTLHAMRKSGLVNRTGRDLWKAVVEA
jgi:hypothetical protein